MRHRVYFTSLGCAKNLIDSEQMLCLLDDAGYELEADPESADIGIVNTCGFIETAKSEAIENILELGKLKEAGKMKKIIVTGCLPQRYKDELLSEMPEIDAIVGTTAFPELIEVLDRVLAGEKVSRIGDASAPIPELGRVVTTGPSWAYIKIAEGCDNHCAYCVIPSIRGKFRSRPMEEIVAEAEGLAESGVKELIIVAQDITRYGMDLFGRRSLAELLRKLCEIKGINWIRLHYLYASEVDEELIDVMAENKKILRYLDIPIQHINREVLKRMNRHDTPEDIKNLFKTLRRRLPGLVLRTSIITGLPGEGEAEFEELCEFLKEFRIERAGVFPYSPEEGTPAAKMERCDTEIACRRAELVEELQSRIMDDFNKKRLKKTYRVLAEGFDHALGCWSGRSYAESPDVDGRIFFTGKGVTEGEFVTVKITGEVDGEPVGEVVKG